MSYFTPASSASSYLYKLDLHGRYYRPTSVGNLYAGGNQAVVTTALTAGLPTAYTGGLILYNPLTSTVNLALNGVGVIFTVAQTNAAAISLGVFYSATTAVTGTLTTLVSNNQLVGSSNTAQGLLYSQASATLPAAPYIARLLKTVDTGALTTTVNGGEELIDLGGSIILQPGAGACILSTATGTASSFLASFVWEEIPA